MKYVLKQIATNKWLLPRQGRMRVDAVLYLRPALKEGHLEVEALYQLAQAAELPGVYRHVVGMPDIHSGYGLPIGGVMAVDAEAGVVSAGAVGMDINCGVRLLQTEIPASEMNEQLLRRLMQAIERRIPAGVGGSSVMVNFSKKQLRKVMTEGVAYLEEQGVVWPDERQCIEEQGAMPGADPAAVTSKAWERVDQLGTLGGGNHFIELGFVEEVYDLDLADKMGLAAGMVTVMIHSGSRGFGHQICTDYSRIMNAKAASYGIRLPSKGLAAVPVNSSEGQQYLAAMICAVNYAFANRQAMVYGVREAFQEVLAEDASGLGLRTVYDVAHNIAKFETHFGTRLLVHRKGATRALPPHHPLNPAVYSETGHPALVPGSMGTGSYVVFGTAQVAETFTSINHGAGRAMSRRAARESISSSQFHSSMGNVLFNIKNYRKIVDEAPLAYKDIDDVVETLTEIGMVRKAVRLKPLAVIKGD